MGTTGSQELEILTKMKNFYSKRYTEQLIFEEKFNFAVMDLIQTGDIQTSTYIKFCIDNDIEPIVKSDKSTAEKIKKTFFKQQSVYTSSGCGSSSSYTRSSC